MFALGSVEPAAGARVVAGFALVEVGLGRAGLKVGGVCGNGDGFGDWAGVGVAVGVGDCEGGSCEGGDEGDEGGLHVCLLVDCVVVWQ